MAAPNIVNVSTITGKSAYVALSTTNATELVSNAASSGKVFKINMIQVTNVDGTNNCNISIDYHNQETTIENSNLLDLNHTKSILAREGKIKTLVYEIPFESIMF